jgi:hypothetical protein
MDEIYSQEAVDVSKDDVTIFLQKNRMEECFSSRNKFLKVTGASTRKVGSECKYDICIYRVFIMQAY